MSLCVESEILALERDPQTPRHLGAELVDFGRITIGDEVVE
jgi:hypothetical protein